MDKLYAMNTFRTVVESGSFTKAAQKMGLSTTTASRLIADLEKQLGASLLHRSTRKITLTDSGYRYFDRCCQHLDDIALTEFSVREQNSGLTGTLRISLPTGFGQAFLAPRLIGFITAYPELKLDLQFSDRVVDLAAEGIDLAVRICQQVSDQLVALPLARIRFKLGASPAYLRQYGTPKTPDELKSHRCLYYLNHREGQAWTLKKDGREFRVPISGTLRTNSGAMLRTAALAGCGIIREPYFSIGHDLRAGDLQAVLDDYELETRSVYAVYPQAGRYSPKIRAFIDYLKQTFDDPSVAGLL
ncbi:MAG TPA: LysR family transcriptional regulator [Rhodocyclaceae bacterium]|nr:LysR family transcriptional regulator [Rhodocyclaceae bacterium]